MCSTRWTSVNSSAPAPPATAAAQFTDQGKSARAARHPSRYRCGAALALVVAGLGAAALGDEAPFYANSFEKRPSVAAMTALGRALFFDKGLSASGKTACASCHDPGRAFGPPNDSAVQRAGRGNAQAGVRAVLSLMYSQNVPPFTEHFFDSEEDDSIDQGAVGGRTWDGRAQSAHDQARLPLFSTFEMANSTPQAVVSHVERAPYAAQLRESFGENVFADGALAFKAILLALETFQQAPAEFYPYTSKYDAYLRNQVALSKEEMRGLAVFDDPARGNCARCHPRAIRGGAFPPFTDFGYAALGVPRNRAIPANADAHYYDLGLCGPLRTDLKDSKNYCGQFRTPSLRNSARRRVFFHNGAVKRLEDAVRFYAERETAPQKWYSRADDGSVMKFDDLPAEYWENLDKQAPFDRRPGDRPPMSEGEIRDVVAFLGTLTDGFEPAKRSAAAATAPRRRLTR